MDLLKDGVWALFKKYLIPSLLTAAAISIFQFIDAVAIGHGVGADGVAALSVATPLFGVTSFVGVFCGMGGSIPMGVALGEGKMREYSEYFTASLVVVSVLSILLWGSFFVFAEQIFRFFGANDRLLPLVMEYGTWMIGFFPFFFFSLYLACIVRMDGAPQLAMWAVVIGGVFNAIGDYLLVFPFRVGTGMAGASIASVIGNAIQVVIFIVYFRSARCRAKIAGTPQLWQRARHVLREGISTGFIDIAFIALVILLNRQILRYGDEVALAVFGAAFTCSSLFQRIFCGIGRAVQPLVSSNYGARQPARILQVFRYAMMTELLISAGLALCGVCFPAILASIFMTATPEVLAAAPGIFRPIFFSYLFLGVDQLATYYFQSMLRSGWALGIAFLRGIALSGACAVVLPLFIGLSGIWWGFVVTEVITFLIACLLFRRCNTELRSSL